MSRYQIDSDAVFATTASVQSSIGRLQSEVAALNGQLGNLQGSWSGQAATAFQGVVADWTATQQRVEHSLAAINEALGRAGQLYADAEAQNARLFAGR